MRKLSSATHVWLWSTALVLFHVVLLVPWFSQPMPGDLYPREYDTRCRMNEIGHLLLRLYSRRVRLNQLESLDECVSELLQLGEFPVGERQPKEYVVDAWDRDLTWKIDSDGNGFIMRIQSVGANGVEERGKGDDIVAVVRVSEGLKAPQTKIYSPHFE